jgi:GT2 family glycosyltransferase
LDNGSTADGHDFLKSLNADYLITSPCNLGTSHAFNLITQISDTPYVYIPNNDHMVCENSVENLIKCLENNEDISVVGSPDTEWILNDLTVCQPGGNPNEQTGVYSLFDKNDLDSWNALAQKFINKNTNNIQRGFFVPSNYMFSKESWKKFGKFRISFNKGWCAVDNYLQEDLSKNNMVYACCWESLLYHPHGGMMTSRHVPRTIDPGVHQHLIKLGANLV